MAFDFPGNVRQLENLCHWLTVMAPAQVVEAATCRRTERARRRRFMARPNATPPAVEACWLPRGEAAAWRAPAAGAGCRLAGGRSSEARQLLIGAARRGGTADASSRAVHPHRAGGHGAAAASRRRSKLGIGRNTITRRSGTRPGRLIDQSASSTTTGAWSLGRSFLRGALSMLAGADARLQRLADEDVVDAQAWFLRNARFAVVPPAPALGRLLERREGVVQAESSGGKCCAPPACSGSAWPRRRVVDVAVFRCDVEVTHQHQLRMRRLCPAPPRRAARRASASCREL